ncbi:MAG: ribonuclease HII [Candidatus Aenigmarchaeota archaeon]|nr:ribonuclease HII [Candidatus Aenigmarchaeota archaeon]
MDFCLPKGAVVGPLVVCGAVFEEGDLPKLKELGVKDSKQLSPARREHLKGRIERLAKLVVLAKLEPWEIDKKRGDGVNLNRLETLKFIEIINAAFRGLKIDRVVIDVPDPNLAKFRLMLTNLIKREGLEIIAEHYADSKYLECSAASVLAKVARDEEIETLKTQYGDFGSGYPSDAKCARWLESYVNGGKRLPKIVRMSWETVSDIFLKHRQSGLKDFGRKKK